MGKVWFNTSEEQQGLFFHWEGNYTKSIVMLCGGTTVVYKYQPLLNYLKANKQDSITLDFTVIEEIIGSPLPASARTNLAWWSNRRTGAVQASAWMEAGYRVTDVSLEEGRVIFSKPQTLLAQSKGETIRWTGELIKALRLHMGLNQAQFANKLGVRQATVSEWESVIYEPTRATSNHLTLLAQETNFLKINN